MKSKITIDLDEDNQPIIKVIYQPSDDVRDKMVARFLESFGHTSIWCKLIVNSIPDGSRTIIRPIGPEELELNINEMIYMKMPILTKIKHDVIVINEDK